MPFPAVATLALLLPLPYATAPPPDQEGARNAEEALLSPASEPPPSPLTDHGARIQRGQRRLTSLVQHLAPPRDRMQVRIQSDSLERAHTARPGLLSQRSRETDIGIFAVEDVWQVEATPIRSTGQSEADVVIACNGLLCSRELKTPAERLRANLVLRAAFPEALLRFIARHGSVMDVLDVASGGTDVLLAMEGGRVLVRTVDLDYDGARVPGLIGLDWVVHDPLLGDVVESLQLHLGNSPAPGVVPGWRIDGPLGAHEVATVTAVALDSGAARTRQMQACEPTWDEAPSIQVAALAPHVYALELASLQSRVVALESEAGWIVLEAPVSSTVGEALIAELERLNPDLGLAYVAVSHHHPHYLGALRPFVARGAVVVCPEAIADYIEFLFDRPWTLQPDELAQREEPVTPSLILVPSGEHWSPPGFEDTLVAVEAGGLSPHTDAHLTFVLPEHRLAFGGDLLWVPRGERAALPPRTVALLRILSATGYEIDEFLTSWPVVRAASLEDTADSPSRWRDRVMLRELAGER